MLCLPNCSGLSKSLPAISHTSPAPIRRLQRSLCWSFFFHLPVGQTEQRLCSHGEMQLPLPSLRDLHRHKVRIPLGRFLFHLSGKKEGRRKALQRRHLSRRQEVGAPHLCLTTLRPTLLPCGLTPLFSSEPERLYIYRADTAYP